ncbi:alanine racemase [Elioraea rosea]|uniref:alanine racemase n=1 Tax=Elioraea rosea TaxID=2492390 RepID=UPI00194FD546|nr:alanine racemase [Elioraea rosea]
MRLADLTTPSLLLELPALKRNLAAMHHAVARHGVALRPHMKTAKSVEVARLATKGEAGGITVSTLAEARYFAAAGFRDQIYAVGITPQKLDAVAEMNARGAEVKVITDDADAAAAIAAHPGPLTALVEVDVGEGRGGLGPDDEALAAIAARLGQRFAGVLTHAGHSYAGRSIEDMRRMAETERAGIVRAAERIRAAGQTVRIVSMGSSPTALHAGHLEGVTEVRAGVYMFGDLLQCQIGTEARDDIAVSVLASVIGRRPEKNQILLDAGALALSKDRSTEAAPKDYGFGLVVGLDGRPSLGDAIVRRAYQEHGVVESDRPLPFDALPIGAKLRVLPNHSCLTAAAYPAYHVLDGSDEIVAVWDRVNYW